MRLSCCGQALVERDESFVPAEGSREGGGEQGSTQASPAASDAPLSLLLTTVVVEGGQACKGGSFFAADPTEFGHADQERKSGAFADPGMLSTRSRRAARSR